MTGFPNGFCGKDCGVMTIGGKKYNLDQINPKDGHDACKLCNCDLAYIQLKAGQRFGGKLKCGAKVSITYSGPPAAPTPPPTPKPQPAPKDPSKWERIGPWAVEDAAATGTPC